MELTQNLFYFSNNTSFLNMTQEAIDTSLIYLFTFYTQRVLKRELSLFEKGMMPHVRHPEAYASIIRAGLARLSTDMRDIKHYMQLIHLSVTNTPLIDQSNVIKHTYSFNKQPGAVEITNKTLKKEVGARVNLYICGVTHEATFSL